MLLNWLIFYLNSGYVCELGLCLLMSVSHPSNIEVESDDFVQMILCVLSITGISGALVASEGQGA
jgi:hypothetical protein